MKMSFCVNPNSTEQLVLLLEFLKESGLSFSVADPEGCEALVGEHSLSDYEGLLRGTCLEASCLTPVCQTRVAPTSAFKNFCGSEYVIQTPKGGMITEEIFLERVHKYVDVTGLRQGTGFQLDETLQTVLQTDRAFLRSYELRSLFRNVVKRAENQNPK